MPKDPKIAALLTGAVAAWLIYSMMTATETPSTALWTLQIVLIGAALIGFAGAVKQMLSDK
jgi:predicted lysophospholipase L1 biosynthesis ABC-type transport system permease subunit